MENPRINLSYRVLGSVFTIGFAVLGGAIYKKFGLNGLVRFLQVSLVVLTVIAVVSIGYFVVKFVISIIGAIGEAKKQFRDEESQVIDKECDDN